VVSQKDAAGFFMESKEIIMTKLVLNSTSTSIKTRKASEAAFGDVFKTVGYKGPYSYMRVELRGPLTNGSAFKSMSVRGFILVVNLGTYEAIMLDGDTPIVDADDITIAVNYPL
jgi:hypothetical protein